MEADMKTWIMRAVGAMATGAAAWLVSWGMLPAEDAVKWAGDMAMAVTAAVSPVVYGLWMRMSDFAMGYFEGAK